MIGPNSLVLDLYRRMLRQSARKYGWSPRGGVNERLVPRPGPGGDPVVCYVWSAEQSKYTLYNLSRRHESHSIANFLAYVKFAIRKNPKTLDNIELLNLAVRVHEHDLVLHKSLLSFRH